ncbi:MAG: hypothetical protein CBC13_03715 [Planctomycetia bacterium TMED53]|nr:MAG: hypothetical protein CBC13_03715 [Planctomycetia bacterium TMED53]
MTSANSSNPMLQFTLLTLLLTCSHLLSPQLQAHIPHPHVLNALCSENNSVSNSPVTSLKKDAIEDFIRFEKLGGPNAELQTSVTTYRNPETDQLVSLVGVVHIGDPGYFRRIQQELDAHDLVLYELVGGPAPGSPEDEGDRPGWDEEDEDEPMLGFIGLLQSGMTDMLELSHQMNGIDYTRMNLRHADLDFGGFAAGLEERGLFNIDPMLVLQGMGSSTFDGLAIQAALASRDDQTTNRVRWAMGKTMAQSVGDMALLGVEDIEKPTDLILGLRNDRAWEIFEESLAENWRRTAIFYGAAHMPDLRRRLVESGWIPEDLFWLGAWKIPVPTEDETENTESAIEARL